MVIVDRVANPGHSRDGISSVTTSSLRLVLFPARSNSFAFNAFVRVLGPFGFGMVLASSQDRSGLARKINAAPQCMQTGQPWARDFYQIAC